MIYVKVTSNPEVNSIIIWANPEPYKYKNLHNPQREVLEFYYKWEKGERAQTQGSGICLKSG